MTKYLALVLVLASGSTFAAQENPGAEKPVVVRSSAVDEDGDKASFAGIYDSYLGVLGADPVIAAVHSCWAAQHGGRAVAYRERLGDG